MGAKVVAACLATGRQEVLTAQRLPDVRQGLFGVDCTKSGGFRMQIRHASRALLVFLMPVYARAACHEGGYVLPFLLFLVAMAEGIQHGLIR